MSGMFPRFKLYVDISETHPAISARKPAPSPARINETPSPPSRQGPAADAAPLTPPATPEQRRPRNTPIHTPTRVATILKKAAAFAPLPKFSCSLHDVFPKPSTKKQASPPFDTIVRAYIQYVANNPEIKIKVDDKKGNDHVRRTMHVGAYIPLSAPQDPWLAGSKEHIMSLLFSTDTKFLRSPCHV